jgi:hypothetical protein
VRGGNRGSMGSLMPIFFIKKGMLAKNNVKLFLFWSTVVAKYHL